MLSSRYSFHCITFTGMGFLPVLSLVTFTFGLYLTNGSMVQMENFKMYPRQYCPGERKMYVQVKSKAMCAVRLLQEEEKIANICKMENKLFCEILKNSVTECESSMDKYSACSVLLSKKKLPSDPTTSVYSTSTSVSTTTIATTTSSPATTTSPTTTATGISQSCQNGGSVTPTGSCLCVDGCYGDVCLECYTDCDSAYEGGIKNGLAKVLIKPADAPSPFFVYCGMSDAGSKTVVMKTSNGNRNQFAKSWDEFKVSFGDANTSEGYWVGLESLFYILKGKDYTATFHLLTLATARESLVKYVGLSMQDESNNYRLSFKSILYDGQAENGLGSTTDTLVFSTNDKDVSGCCAIHNAPWWYDATNCWDARPMTTEYVMMWPFSDVEEEIEDFNITVHI